MQPIRHLFAFLGDGEHKSFKLRGDNGGPMNVIVKLSVELKNWLAHNLNRECAPDDLVRSMVSEGFDPAIARALVDEFILARDQRRSIISDTLTLAIPPPEYRHEGARIPSGNVLRAEDRAVPVLLRFERPVIAVLADVLSGDECDRLIELSRERLRPSTVVDPTTGLHTTAEHRNSFGMFFRPGEIPLVAALDRRLSQLMNAPVDNGEGLQILRYGPGTQSTPHFDFLIPSNEANRQSLARSGQRVSSLVVYLNDVAAGGETIFPEIGLSVTPKKGNAVYFEYCNSLGQVDPLSLHAGAPVVTGEKWAATKWMRQRRFVSA
jgi:prolyl 4-hydroxylase